MSRTLVTIFALLIGGCSASAEDFRIACSDMYFDISEQDKSVFFVNDKVKPHITRFDSDFIKFEMDRAAWEIDRVNGVATYEFPNGRSRSIKCEKQQKQKAF